MAEWLEWVGRYTQPEVAFNYLNSISDVKEPSYLIQVNGKVKDKLEADESASNDELQALALASDKIKELTDGKDIVKVIVVPKKLVNIVVKG